MGDDRHLTTGATARAARAVERAACRELVERCGHDPGLFDVLTGTDPEHRPDYVRIVDIGGRPVCLALVVPRLVRLAGVWVEGAVLALVGTDPAYRGQGLIKLLLEDTVAFLRARGFRLGMIYGSPGLCRRFGFVPCLGNYATVIDPARVLVPGAGLGGPSGRRVWRPAVEQDVPALTSLYDEATAHTPCTVLRPPEAWVWRDRGGGSGLVVCQDDVGAEGPPEGEPPSSPAAGRVCAYVRWSSHLESLPDDTLGVAEVAAASPAALGAALEWVAGKAAESGFRSVQFVGPPDHPFARLAYLRAGAETVIRPALAGQVVVTNRGLLMADLAEALAERATAAGILPGTTVVLDVGSKRFELSFVGGQLRFLGGRAGRHADVPVSRLSAEAFTVLLTGYAGGAEIEALPGVSLAGDHRPVLEALFPRSFPKWIPAPYW